MRIIRINGKTLDEYLIENQITIGELQRCILTDDGYEVNNPLPLVLDTGLKRPPTLAEQIKRVLRAEIDRSAMDGGMESYEDANDFDVDEEELPVSKYEVMEDEVPIEAPAEPAQPQPKAAESEVKDESSSDNEDTPSGV